MLVWRRANSARSLLAAAAAAALIATVLLAGLTDYNRSVIVAGGQSAVAAAPAKERALLVQGPATSNEQFQSADGALRRSLEAGLGGAEVAIASAGYASGRQLTGETGTATGDAEGLIFASLMFLDGLPGQAKLIDGAWPQPGANPVQTVIGEPAANLLGLKPGSLVPVTDRRTDKVTTVVVSGVFAAQRPDDSYWLLAPEMSQGSLPGGTTYGPFVLDRSDYFSGGWVAGGSASWMVEPELAEAELKDLLAVREVAKTLPTTLPKAMGMGSSVQAVTSLDQLVDRLQRADLVGRSALLTPLLLIIVLGGYALLLLAGLLTEQRRSETALLRARGAARGQLAGLAVREAVLVALPAVVLAPLLVSQLLGRSDQLKVLADVNLHPEGSLGWLTWSVAIAAGVGCVLAMLAPALKAGTSYVDDMAARSRPSKATAIQRAGVDLALIAFAMLAWFQLRQYSSPLAGVGGELGIDPLLAAAAPIGVLAGSVLALRLLPPLTRLAERVIDRRPWFAAQLGVWQAGRRPHAGPVLLLALAVAVSTLAWALAQTAGESMVDQANHTAGADLRLTETSGFAPGGRAQAIAELPGVKTALPAWRTTLPLGEKSTATTILALDAAQAGDVVKLRSDLGDSGELFGGMWGKRVGAPSIPLPPGTSELRGALRTSGDGTAIVTYLVLMDKAGGQHRLRLPDAPPDRRTVPFQVKVTGGPLTLAGFLVEGAAWTNRKLSWEVEQLSAVTPGGTSPIDLSVDWTMVADLPGAQDPPTVVNGGLSAVFTQRQPTRTSFFDRRMPGYRFSVTRPVSDSAPVPAIATTTALEVLHKNVGDEVSLTLGGQEVPIVFLDSLTTLPGTGGEPAILLDLPSLSNVYLHRFAETQAVQEWWLGTDAAQHAAAAAGAAKLTNMRIYDRHDLAKRAGQDPYGVGARLALFIAALGAMALALVGVAVDVRATARRRIGELAVLHTLGATPRLLARALVTEQAFLAGLGVMVGLVVGIGVAATMAPLVILTPTAARPIPEPLLRLDWLPVLGTAGLLLAIAMSMAGLVALTMRNRLNAAQLRMGVDR